MKKHIRNIIGLFFVGVILFTLIFIFIKKDEIFRNEVTVTYNDGCVEKYVNAELVTEKCIEIVSDPFISDVYLYNGSSLIYFNESKLNATIEKHILEKYI